MGLLSWWNASREKAAFNRRSLAISDDKELRASQVPELIGMSDVEGMAHTLQAIENFHQACSPEESAEFRRRLLGSQQSFTAEGLLMPYWGNLWVLRTYQRELGLDAPAVAPPVASA